MSGSNGSTVAERLALFTAETKVEAVPGAVLDGARMRVLDTLGCGLAAHAAGYGTAPRAALLELHSQGPATVLGSARGLPAPAAACANGTLCHALDYDDTHSAAIVNVGAIVVPAALAVTEATGASPAQMLAAVVLGSEVLVRLGLAAAPAFPLSGFHPAAVCGVFGATAAASRLLGMGPQTTAAAFAIAGSLASGTYEPLRAGATTKMLHAGWAAQSGILAALLARAGQDGPPTALEGPYGVFASYFRLGPAALFDQLHDLGDRWEGHWVSVRAYPVCYLAQSVLDAVQDATGGRPLRPEEVRRVAVSIPAAGVPIVLEPRAAKLRPPNSHAARFSLPYCVAAMLVRGAVDMSSFAVEAIADEAILSVAGRVVYEPGDFPGFPASYPGGVVVETMDGDILRARVEHERGGPANPMTEDEIRAKFRANARPALGEEATDRLEQAVGKLGEGSVGAVARALRETISPYEEGKPARGASPSSRRGASPGAR